MSYVALLNYGVNSSIHPAKIFIREFYDCLQPVKKKENNCSPFRVKFYQKCYFTSTTLFISENASASSLFWVWSNIECEPGAGAGLSSLLTPYRIILLPSSLRSRFNLYDMNISAPILCGSSCDHNTSVAFTYVFSTALISSEGYG